MRDKRSEVRLGMGAGGWYLIGMASCWGGKTGGDVEKRWPDGSWTLVDGNGDLWERANLSILAEMQEQAAAGKKMWR